MHQAKRKLAFSTISWWEIWRWEKSFELCSPRQCVVYYRPDPNSRACVKIEERNCNACMKKKCYKTEHKKKKEASVKKERRLSFVSHVLCTPWMQHENNHRTSFCLIFFYFYFFLQEASGTQQIILKYRHPVNVRMPVAIILWRRSAAHPFGLHAQCNVRCDAGRPHTHTKPSSCIWNYFKWHSLPIFQSLL